MADQGNVVANVANAVNNPAGEENLQQANLWSGFYEITLGPIALLTFYFIECMFGKPQTLTEIQIKTIAQQHANICTALLVLSIFLITVILIGAPRPLNYWELFFGIARFEFMFLTICFISPKLLEDPRPPNYDDFDDFDDFDF